MLFKRKRRVTPEELGAEMLEMLAPTRGALEEAIARYMGRGVAEGESDALEAVLAGTVVFCGFWGTSSAGIGVPAARQAAAEALRAWSSQAGEAGPAKARYEAAGAVFDQLVMNEQTAPGPGQEMYAAHVIASSIDPGMKPSATGLDAAIGLYAFLMGLAGQARRWAATVKVVPA